MQQHEASGKSPAASVMHGGERSSGCAHVGSDIPFDVEDARELLEAAARRHRTIRERLVDFGGDSSASQYPVKDVRKYDYPLSSVTRPSTATTTGSHTCSSSSASVIAATATVSANGGRIDSLEDSSAPAASWRNQLQLHVVHLLQKLRVHPSQLRDFLLMDYEDEEEENARRRIVVDLGGGSDEDSDEDEGGERKQGSLVDEKERRARRDRAHKKRMGKNYAKLRLVFKHLHRVALTMGEQLYQQVHSMLRRSVVHGVISREANLVRLESIYKLELRRQVTTEKLLETVKMKDAEWKRKQERNERDEQHVRRQTLRRNSTMIGVQGGDGAAMEVKKGNQNASEARNAGGHTGLVPLWEQNSESKAINSAHVFKMHALERVLAVEWQHPDASCSRSSCRFPGDAGRNPAGAFPPRLVSEQTEDLIHEKLTAFLYSKNRDTFPVWKEPPEGSFSREETLRHLKRLLPILMTMPLLHGLTIDQLLEFVRVTKWKTVAQGQKVVSQGAIMEELIVIMDGAVDFLSEVAGNDSSSELKSVLFTASAATVGTDQADASSSLRNAANPNAKGMAAHFGELGMLSKTEVWRSTILAKTSVVKAVVISRSSFDVVLQKLFGSSKSRQLLFVAQQRPSSSPAASARTPVPMSPTRPSTAAAIAARDKHVAALKQLQENGLQQRKQLEEQQRAEAAAKTSGSLEESMEQSGAGANPSTSDSRSGANDRVEGKPRYSGSAIQHYPSFHTSSTDASSASGIGHLFRLRWAHPIAFEMESIGESVYNEWAPSFPDTSALVDFLSSSSLSSTCLLFEKNNVLLKENLRSVCFHPPFLDGATDHGASSDNEQIASDHPSSPAGAHMIRGATVSREMRGSNPMAQHGAGGADNGPMTLAQFSEARKKMNGRGMSRRHLGSSSSMQNLLPLPAPSPSSSNATVMKLGHLPFSRSSFVTESSFRVDHKGTRRKPEVLSSNNEVDEDEECGDDEASDSVERVHQFPETQTATGIQASGEKEQTDDPLNDTTRARKVALDSLMHTISASSPRKSKLLDQDAAKQIIVQKYLQASNPRAPSSGHAKGTHTESRVVANPSPRGPNGINTGIHSSHAPLPLRVDLQRRMELVLAALKMKPKAKLDLVLKYTHADHCGRFQMAVVLWEQALHYIAKREAAMANLRKFELVASDPRRHFRSLSTHRLTEQKERDSLFCQLNDTSDVCREALGELEKQCGDKVYYESRLYVDKMKKDYTELLFEVEQERLHMIYSGVHPSVSSADVGDEREPSTPCLRPLDEHDSPLSATASKRRKSFTHGASGLSALPATNNNDEDKDEHPSLMLSVSGRTTTSSGIRNRLSNPQESIYVSIAEQRDREERRAAEELQRELEPNVAQEEKERRRKSSHGVSHRMAMQVQLRRQIELDELSHTLQPQHSEDVSRTGSIRRHSKSQRSDIARPDQLRSPTATKKENEPSPATSDLAFLQRALHHFIHRPKD